MDSAGSRRDVDMPELWIGRTLATGIAAAGLAVAATGATPEIQPAEGLRAQQIARNAAIATHDRDRLGSVLAEDVSFSSHILHRQGRDAVIETWTGLWTRRPDLQMTFQADRTRASASFNAVAESGTWTERWTETDGLVTLSGTYLTVWSKDKAGQWRIAAETIAPLRCKGGAYCRR